jgi:membrane fusion protein, multidrug efflux system
MPNHRRPEDHGIEQPSTPLAQAGQGPEGNRPRRGSNLVWTLVLLAVVGLVVWFARDRQRAKIAAGRGGPGSRPGAGVFPVPIVPGVVQQKDVPVYLDGLGTVQAFNTVTVRSRVDGQVTKIAFVEGQDVHAGDVLAQIDPAPFQAQLAQNLAKKAQDEAQLAIARLTLTRNKELLNSKILSQQEYDAQQAVVDQLVATVQGDQAAIDSARVQLDYTTISSPIDGRTGIRMVDQGNIVHANDTTGLVVIAQLRPITLSFTLPEQTLPQIRRHLSQPDGMTVLALDRDNRATLSQGKLAVIDNQIDITTGTIRLKATFANDDLKLWPGQFVNVRLLLETRHGAVVPASVVQRGPDGDFAFVIADDLTAQVRKIRVAQVDRGQALIEEGLSPGERVVVDGQYKLQPGSKVKLPDSKGSSEPPPGGPAVTARASGTS